MLRCFDRSRVVTDWQCPRRRYLQYELNGTGVVPSNDSLELYLGTVIHDALACIAYQYLEPDQGHKVDIDEIANLARQQVYDELVLNTSDQFEDEFALEQSALIEGMIRGFYRAVWPSLAACKIIAVEEEVTVDFGNDLVFMSRPDLIIEDAEGRIIYVEYKSTSDKKEKWINSWSTAVQLHSSLRAVEATLGVKPSHVVVQGLYKGFESYGKQSSPFCYAYTRPAQPPFIKEEVQYEYKAGLRRTPTWQRPGGVKQWVADMPDHVLQEQFPCTPPIFIKEDLIETFFAQRVQRELMIADFHNHEWPEVNNALNVYFPQRFDQCNPSFGRPCAYRVICHGAVADPLKQGFVPREPHHQLEIDMWEQKEKNDI